MDIIKVLISSVFPSENEDDEKKFRYSFEKEREELKRIIGNDGGNNLKDISLCYGKNDSRYGSFEKSLNQVSEADIIILFIGTKYGSIRSENGISLTHEEYLKAIEEDKQILVYEFPSDEKHEQYQRSKEFRYEIYNKKIPTNISKRFGDDFPNIIDFKKGKDIQLKDEEIKFYLIKLTSEIYGDLLSAKADLLLLPKGVERFQEDGLIKDKLNLDYIKRSDYKKLYNLSEDFLSEIDIFNKIFKEDKLGILIYGEGGIGKTRLSKELALMAKNDEWQVLTIDPKCDDLDNIKYKKNSNYCLFFEDIVNQMFSKDEIEKHIKKHCNKNKIRVILNSRNTYVNIDDYRDDNNFIDLNISSINNENVNEKEYINFVIENMLLKNEINKETIQLESLIKKPSFAIFILKTKGKIEDLKTTNFRKYLKDFFQKSFEHEDFNKIEPIYFHILANLPLHEEIKKVYGKEIDILGNEKLIEFDNNDEMFKASFNDTIIDELLDIYLNKSDFKPLYKFKDEIQNFFKFSLDENTFKNIINSFGKISSNEIIRNRSDVFKDELKKDKYKELISENIVVFKKSSILNELDKLDIRKEHDNISITSKEYAFALSRAITQILISNNNFEKFESLFDNWIKNNNENSLKFLYQDLSASFIICAIYDYYIKYKEIEIFDINFYAERYLENFVDNPNISFIFEKYLNHNESIGKIEDSIIKYINLFSNKENCSYMIQKYLDNNGSIGKIEDSIIKYINLFSDKENCSFVIQKYLDNNGSIEKIEDSIIKYIHIFNNSYVVQKYFTKVDYPKSFNNLNILGKYLDYLKFPHKNYDKLILLKENINNLVNSYTFNMNNLDFEDYILVVLRIQEKNKKIFSDDVEKKILREITEYLKKALFTTNYLKIINRYLKIAIEPIKPLIFEIINKKINYSIINTLYLDDYDNLLELIKFIDVKNSQYIDICIKNEVIKRIFILLKDKNSLHYIERDLTKNKTDTTKLTEEIINFLKYDIEKQNEDKINILIEFINFLPISDIVEDKLTIYFSLFQYLIAKNPELINNNILNIRDKYLEFLELSRSFSKTKKNRLRGIYSEKFTNEEISNLIFKIIKENSENTFIIQIIIKFILAKNDFSLLKEDIEKFVKKNSKEAFDKFYNDDIEILKSLKLFVESI